MEDLSARLAQAESKLVDFGNACWTHKQFTQDIQTRQYRCPEACPSVLGPQPLNTACSGHFKCPVLRPGFHAGYYGPSDCTKREWVHLAEEPRMAILPKEQPRVWREMWCQQGGPEIWTQLSAARYLAPQSCGAEEGPR